MAYTTHAGNPKLESLCLKVECFRHRNSMPFSTLPGETSGRRIIECESGRVGISSAWVFPEVPLITRNQRLYHSFLIVNLLAEPSTGVSR